MNNVLLVEDNPGDARLISAMFDEVDGEQFHLCRVDRLADGLDYLARGEVGVILLDLSLPDSLGMETFTRVFAQVPQIPIIVLTGTDDEVLALHAVKTGAQDYLIKGQVDAGVLLRAMRYAMERKQAERALRDSEERYALAAAGSNDGLWDLTVDTSAVYYSPRWKTMLGYTEQDIGALLDDWLQRVHPDDLSSLRQQLEARPAGASRLLELEYRMRHKDGSYRWVLCRGIALSRSGARSERIAGSQTDIHERKRAAEQLLHDALHDTLTGLANRALLLNRLELALEHTARTPDRLFAILFVDLDRFKNVNDSLGHLAGDQLLLQCSQRLASNCRPADTLARLGGDEFILLLDGISGDADAIHVAERILVQLREPFRISGHELHMAASIGIAFNSPNCASPEALLRDADTAMYSAKAQGKACYSVFAPSMHTQAVASLHLENKLRRAIDREHFRLQYQPVISLDSGDIVGFEALIRWDREDSCLLQPDDFIPLAEETGLIVPIGKWALFEACRQLADWHQLPGRQQIAISVNVSCRQFAQDTLVAQVVEALASTGIRAANLKLEVTESVLMGNADGAARKLQELRDLGVGISMDDFGTGYSSLSYLQRFPIDTLKIDKSFVARMENGGQGIEVVRAILSIARAFKLNVVAEGMETFSQVDILASLGCAHGQGYYFSPPLWRDDATRLLQQGTRYRS